MGGKSSSKKHIEQYNFDDTECPKFSLETLQQDENLVSASKAISECDVLLFASGAGWSKDSGLETYEEVRNNGLDYYNLSQPQLLFEDPSMFYGFHGAQLKRYRETKPHVGYNILKTWKHNLILKQSRIPKFPKAQSKIELTEFPFFIVTSNIDAHFWTSGLFNQNEIAEIHGNIEFWQCSSGVTAPGRGMCGASRKCDQKPWRLDSDYEIQIEKTTGKAIEPYPKCSCGAPARPNVLMFKDRVYDDTGENSKFVKWWDTIVDSQKTQPDLKVVVVEVGSGLIVPSIRIKTSHFCQQSRGTLIRVNPDSSNLEDTAYRGDEGKFISINETGLNAMRKLDCLIKAGE